MQEAVVVTERLTKDYGNGKGVHDLDLEVRRGEVFGFLGPNGAGKTTTIRLLLDLIRPTSGRATVLGYDCQAASVEVRRRVGYLPGELELYENLTGDRFLRYVARLRGGVDGAYVTELANRLECDLRRPIGDLSKGNKQKIGLIQALMSKPPLLVLDEPTSGLDPLMQRAFNDLVTAATDEGRTVLLSSHVLSEIEHVCDRIAMVKDGRLATVDTMENLRRRSVRRLELAFSGPVDPAAFEDIPGIRDLELADGRLRCTIQGDLDALVKTAAKFTVVDVVSREAGLDELFLALYADAERSDAHA